MEMNQSHVFWTAFWAGLAAPVMLFAAPTPYYLYLANSTVAQSFGAVGAKLALVYGINPDVGHSSAGTGVDVAA
jgi:hypothetical protein